MQKIGSQENFQSSVERFDIDEFANEFERLCNEANQTMGTIRKLVVRANLLAVNTLIEANKQEEQPDYETANKLWEMAENCTKVSAQIGLTLSTLRNKMDKYHLDN